MCDLLVSHIMHPYGSMEGHSNLVASVIQRLFLNVPASLSLDFTGIAECFGGIAQHQACFYFPRRV